MPVLKPRNRLIYFRISDDEFKQFCEMCQSEGARSLSDLARSALKRLMKDGSVGSDQNVTQKLTALEDIVGELRLEIRRLTQRLKLEVGSPDTPESGGTSDGRPKD